MLSGMQPDDGDEDVLEVLGPLREKVVSAICATPSLYEVVELMAVLYPDRLVFWIPALHQPRSLIGAVFVSARRPLSY